MKRKRLSALLTITGLVVLSVATAAPAGAVVVDPGCTGSVTFEEGVNVSEVSGNRVTESHPLSPTITIPSEATVSYAGEINVPPPDEPVDFAGGIDLQLPLFGGITIVSWPDPPGQTEMTSDSGSYTYSLPSYVPKGTGGLELTARHTQQGETCVVKLNIALAGSSSPVGILTGAATALFGALMVSAGFKKKGSG